MSTNSTFKIAFCENIDNFHSPVYFSPVTYTYTTKISILVVPNIPIFLLPRSPSSFIVELLLLSRSHSSTSQNVVFPPLPLPPFLLTIHLV